MTGSTRMTGAVAALLVLLGLGLFGQVGWLAAIVLAAITGLLLGGMLHWLVDQGSPAMDGSAWDPRPAMADPVAEAAPQPVATPKASGDLVAPDAGGDRALPPAGRSIYPDPAPRPDDLRAIKGIGVKVEQALLDAGITRYDQIAAWTDAEIDAMAARIGRAVGRIRNDDWVGQARDLAARRGQG